MHDANVIKLLTFMLVCLVSLLLLLRYQDFPEELQSLPSQTYPPGPDSDLKGGFRVPIRSKSGQNRVKIRSGGRVSEGVGFRGVGPGLCSSSESLDFAISLFWRHNDVIIMLLIIIIVNISGESNRPLTPIHVKKHRDTAPISISYFCKSMPSSWQKIVYTPPICITIRLPFVSRYFCRSIRVRGRWDTCQYLF